METIKGSPEYIEKILNELVKYDVKSYHLYQKGRQDFKKEVLGLIDELQNRGILGAGIEELKARIKG